MELEQFVFEASKPKELAGSKLPNPLKGAMYCVCIQVAKNTKPLRAGQLLYVSTMREDMDVDHLEEAAEE